MSALMPPEFDEKEEALDKKEVKQKIKAEIKAQIETVSNITFVIFTFIGNGLEHIVACSISILLSSHLIFFKWRHRRYIKYRIFAILLLLLLSYKVYLWVADYPGPVFVQYKTYNDYVPSELIPTTALKSGATLRVVNCIKNVSLREEADGNEGHVLDLINLDEEVIFLRLAENGYYYISYGKQKGYVLACFLAPIDSEIFEKHVSLPDNDHQFDFNDLKIGNFTIGKSDIDTVRAQLGEPLKRYRANDGLIWEFSDTSYIFNQDDLLVKQVIFGPAVIGPRNITVDINFTEALNTFVIYKPSIYMPTPYSYSDTHDLLLYTTTENKKDGSYAAIINDGLGGNGYIEFKDSKEYACMDIQIENSTVNLISVYVNVKNKPK